MKQFIHGMSTFNGIKNIKNNFKDCLPINVLESLKRNFCSFVRF